MLNISFSDSFIFFMKGKLDAELILLTKEEVEASPAGKGREEPDPMDPPKYVILACENFSSVHTDV